MNEAAAEAACEVCGKAPARRADLLCPDCSRAFTIMLELLANHPELAADDLERIKEVFQWRMEKIAPLRPRLPRPEVTVEKEAF